MNVQNIKIRRSVVPYYAVAAIWAMYAFLFDLYAPLHFLIVLIISISVFLLSKLIFKDQIITEGQNTNKSPIDDSPTGNEELDRVIQEGKEAIEEIHFLNDKINAPELSDDVGRIEEVASKIFDHLRKNPQKLPQARRFINYYLPTTTKLLKIYESVDSVGISGKNIDETKRRVISSMGIVVKSFEGQLDNLFSNEALDLSSEITVLETMLKQEGIIGDQIQIVES